MNSSDQYDDALADLLKVRYAATPDAGFTERLLAQLQAQLPGRQPAQRLYRRMAVAASLAAAVITCTTLYLRSRPAGHPAAVLVPKASPSIPGDAAGGTATEWTLSLAQVVGGAPLIVRARVAEWKPPLVRYTLSYIIYGDCDEKVITVDLSGILPFMRDDARDRLKRQTGKEPTEAAIDADVSTDGGMGLDLNHDTIVLLAPHGATYERMGGIHAPKFQLDDYEDRVIKTIADGSAFEPQPWLAADAQLIVRAELLQVGGAKSKWKITRVIKGDDKASTLVLDDQFFRRRAQAIVAYKARRASTSPATQPAAAESTARLVDAETARLMSSELDVHEEAILFVDQVQSAADSVTGRLRYGAYRNQQKEKLDKLQDAILRPGGSKEE